MLISCFNLELVTIILAMLSKNAGWEWVRSWCHLVVADVITLSLWCLHCAPLPYAQNGNICSMEGSGNVIVDVKCAMQSPSGIALVPRKKNVIPEWRSHSSTTMWFCCRYVPKMATCVHGVFFCPPFLLDVYFTPLGQASLIPPPFRFFLILPFLHTPAFFFSPPAPRLHKKIFAFSSKPLVLPPHSVHRGSLAGPCILWFFCLRYYPCAVIGWINGEAVW